ncbi:MAG: putative transposase [Verrucomicrobiales bacterium]|jgi:putative transposase
MPARRLIYSDTGSAYYHCVSRVVDRDFKLEEHERDVFRKILRQVEAFSGVRVLTWTVLSNHFHVLAEVPPRPALPPSDEEILERCRSLYAPEGMVVIELEFADAQRCGGVTLQRLRERFLTRMWNLSEFMKTLKQKFTKWFNRKHERVGTLWESRFKSVVIEGEWNSLMKVAAYIDLNPVRAGLVDDPKDYRWCGYAEALAGETLARQGLIRVLADSKPSAQWRDVAPRYRKLLFGSGEKTASRAGISRDAIAKVWASGGKLSLAQLLRCRVRYMTDGLAIGTEGFLERLLKTKREHFSSKRQSAARKMRGGDWGTTRTARELRCRVISVGGDG